MTLLTFLLFFDLQKIYLEGVYEPAVRHKIVMASDGSIFYLTTNYQIIHIDQRGHLLNTFSRRGNGPAELNAPVGIGCENDRIWVIDLNFGVKVFDIKGNFLNTIKLSGASTNFARWGDAWISLKYSPVLGSKASIIQWGPDSLQKKNLHTWIPNWTHKTKFVRSLQGDVPYNPAKEVLHFAVDVPGHHAYIVPPDTILQILGFSPGNPVKIFKLPGTPRKFNKDWGIKQVRESRTSKAHLVLDAPAFFPLAKGLVVTPDGNLVLEKWTSDPDVRREFVVIDGAGKAVDLGYDPRFSYRILFIRKGKAYLNGYNSEKDLSELYLCSVKDIDLTCKKFPLVYPRKDAWVALEPI